MRLLIFIVSLFITYTSLGAEKLTNPYMIYPLVIDMPSCISSNEKDCLKSVCIAAPATCHQQCRTNAQSKCAALTKQRIDAE
jgi:hypothetical protein